MEAKHVVLKIGVGQQALTGPQADEYVSKMLKDGWTLKHVQALGIEPGVVNVFYLFTRGTSSK